MALLVERVDIGTEGLNVRLRVDGRGGLVQNAGWRHGSGRMTRGTPIPETVTLHAPFRVLKPGVRTEIQLPGGC